MSTRCAWCGSLITRRHVENPRAIRKRASQGCCVAPLKNGSRIFNIPANGSHRADHHRRHRLARYFTRAVFPFVMAGTKKSFWLPAKKAQNACRAVVARWYGRCPGHHALICGFSGGKKNIKFYFWTKHHTRNNSSIS